MQRFVTVTHYDCPNAPADGMTHHLTVSYNTRAVGTARCEYCGRSERELREQYQTGEFEHERHDFDA